MNHHTNLNKQLAKQGNAKGNNMVMAKLHLICGNCGEDKDFKYKCEDYPADAEEKHMQLETTITCNNCSTIHWLNEKATNKNKMRPKE